MTLRDILVHVDDLDEAPGRVAVAVDLAVAHDAHVTGLGVQVASSMPGYAMSSVPDEFLAQIRDQQQAAVATAKATFEAKVKHAGWVERSEWMQEAGNVADILGRYARCADLTIIGQQREGVAGTAAVPDDFVLYSGRPVLIIPFVGAARSMGRRVVVAWNAGPEAARAVADAMPILERADNVQVLSIEPHDMGDLPGADLSLHLARHGISTEAKRSVATDIDAADVLLNFVSDVDADLVVMGAYGHSRMREIVFGGMTRHVLAHMTVPVFMSH